MKYSHLRTPRQMSDCYWRDETLTNPDRPKHWIAALVIGVALGLLAGAIKL